MSISSSNTVLTLSQPILFPVPVQLQGFANDDVYDIPEITVLESSMGVDGRLSFGFVFSEVMMNVALQADSLSNLFFDTLYLQQVAAQDAYPLNGVIILPSIFSKLSLRNGGLKNYKPTPDSKKTLQPRRFGIVWERVVPFPTI